MSVYNVTEGQLKVDVSMVVLSARRLSSGLSYWQVYFEIIADQQSADHIFEATETLAVQTATFEDSLKASFQDAGLTLDAGSLSLVAPEMKVVTVTMTSVSMTGTTTATSRTGTATSSTSLTTAPSCPPLFLAWSRSIS